MPARSQSASGEDMAMLGSVTERVLAGQQTAICKHHEGKHQSTLDFFLYNFFVVVNTLKTDPQRLSKVKKKMAFPSWVDGEGKDRGQFILLSDSLSSSWCPQGGGRTIFWKSVQKGCPVPSGVPSSALSSVRGASSQEQGCLSLCGRKKSVVLRLVRAAAPSHGGSSVSL